MNKMANILNSVKWKCVTTSDYFLFDQSCNHKSLFVMIAWLSMAVDPTAIPGRISMVMMTLLTLMAMFSGVRQNTPKVRKYQ